MYYRFEVLIMGSWYGVVRAPWTESSEAISSIWNELYAPSVEATYFFTENGAGWFVENLLKLYEGRLMKGEVIGVWRIDDFAESAIRYSDAMQVAVRPWVGTSDMRASHFEILTEEVI